MPLQLGIGIATHNRCHQLERTLGHLGRHTKYGFVSVAVADDGSTDATLEMLRDRNVLTVTGHRMGAAWNGNRALFLLSELQRCDIVILLQDDCHPGQDEWELAWMNAALHWGHAGFAADRLQPTFLSGSGTVEDPVRSVQIGDECAVYSREALLFGGYFDPRFHGRGPARLEHANRLARAGYGGAEEETPDGRHTVFKLLHGGIRVAAGGSAPEPADADGEHALYQTLLFDDSYRSPWFGEEQMRQFRDEMRAVTPRVL